MHVPVLLNELLGFLDCKKDKVYIDCTVGTGGHAEAVLERSGPTGILIGIDRDSDSLNIANERLSKFKNRFFLFHGNFKNMREVISETGVKKVDGIYFDLGLSSLQLDNPARGFSFRFDSFLDMRMNQKEGNTASFLLNHLSEKELSEIFFKFGEERYSNRIAKRIVNERKNKNITTTYELRDIILKSVPYYSKKHKIHPATRIFQAVRIAVNDELNSIETGLNEAIDILSAGGIICAISFHSLEDRIVKRKFKELLKVITPKPVVPTEEEITSNLRARSAKLRAAQKV